MLRTSLSDNRTEVTERPRRKEVSTKERCFPVGAVLFLVPRLCLVRLMSGRSTSQLRDPTYHFGSTTNVTEHGVPRLKHLNS